MWDNLLAVMRGFNLVVIAEQPTQVKHLWIICETFDEKSLNTVGRAVRSRGYNKKYWSLWLTCSVTLKQIIFIAIRKALFGSYF